MGLKPRYGRIGALLAIPVLAVGLARYDGIDRARQSIRLHTAPVLQYTPKAGDTLAACARAEELTKERDVGRYYTLETQINDDYVNSAMTRVSADGNLYVGIPVKLLDVDRNGRVGCK